jgi:beta-glucanase (GH16 family)
MKNYKSRGNIILLALIFIINLSCKNKTNVTDDEIIIVDTMEPHLNEVIDPKTPKGVQPFVVDVNKQLIANVKTVQAPNGYDLVFSDEFNDKKLNTRKWNITISEKTRAPRTDKGISSWFWVDSHVSVNGNELILKASKLNSKTMNNGSVDSRNKFDQKFGFIEARMSVADIQKAVHSAFWMTSSGQGNINGTGADGCEVDIFESAFINGQRTQTALHWDGYGSNKGAWTKHWNNAGNFGADIHKGFHIFGLEWDETGMSIYYDGVKMFTYAGVGNPLVKQYLWLSVGASFGDGEFQSRAVGDLTDAKVDWVRVYSKK